jgi:hypothetical protein
MKSPKQEASPGVLALARTEQEDGQGNGRQGVREPDPVLKLPLGLDSSAVAAAIGAM